MNLCIKNEASKQRLGKELQVELGDIVLTKDNIIKMAIIYLRIMSRIPVIIMGETGVGKTILIKYLSKLTEAQI